MRILVTGANGYLGVGIVKALLDLGHQVVATDLTVERIDSRAQKIKSNIFELEDPFNYFDKPDCLLHLAWRDGFEHFSDAHIVDLPKHKSFLEKMCFSGIKSISIMGTMHEIGFYEGSINETTPCRPQNYYGISKNTLRELAMIICKKKGIEFKWLRAFYIVNNSANGNSIFSKIVQAVNDGKESFPFTTGQNQYDFLDYEDFCNYVALATVQKKETGIINICSGHPESLSSRVERFIKENEYNIRLDYGAFPDRPYDSKAIWGNNEKISRIIEASKIKTSKNKFKAFVTGVCGQLGYDVMNELKRRGYESFGSDIIEKSDDNFVKLDITDKGAVDRCINEINPDAVIHCAAWTAVDAAEHEENKAKVYAVNVIGTKNIAEACKKIGCKMIYISTDYVFNGQGTEPWQADCKEFAPLNYYGQTKLEGELAVAETLEKYFIVRIAWVFGLNGKNFIKTMINISKTHDTVRVVNDQIGTPTYTYDLAKLLVDMVETEKYGYYHATNEGGYISWYDFCCEFYKQYGLATKVIPVTTEEYGLSKAARPFNSRLDKSKLIEAGFKPLPTWQDAVKRYLEEAKL